MSGKSMQTKGGKIVSVGVSLKLCGPERAVCFEESKTDREVFHKMQETVRGCDFFA